MPARVRFEEEGSVAAPRSPRILYCNCSYADVLPVEVKRRVYAALASSGVHVEAVADLCEAAATRSPVLARTAGQDAPVVIACHARAVRWLFEWAGSPLPPGATILNMREASAEDVLDRLEGVPAVAAETEPDVGETGEWVPWFPVIDYDRCRNCGQCLSFCLFGVYELDEDERVRVASPDSCKNNCPACARICPEVAIIFPKLREAPINGADIVDEDDARANVRVNVDRILGNDVYAALAERRKRAKKRILDRAKIRQAIEERRACAGEKAPPVDSVPGTMGSP